VAWRAAHRAARRAAPPPPASACLCRHLHSGCVSLCVPRVVCCRGAPQDKILQSMSNGSIMITNDGATILGSITVDNPAAKVLINISKTQDDEVGDGTTRCVPLLLLLPPLRRQLHHCNCYCSAAAVAAFATADAVWSVWEVS
jgi:hypothetical protein